MKLHNIGAAVRSIRPPPRTAPGMLAGSRGAPTMPTKPPIARVVVVQRCPSYTHDPRYQCAPGEQTFGAGFQAVGPGRDINTGRAWG